MNPNTVRRMFQALGILVGALIVSAIGGVALRGGPPVAPAVASVAAVSDLEPRELIRRLDAAQGDLAVLQIRLDRAEAVMDYSAHYQIPADLSAAIYDAAVREGLDPDLAFRLVHVESRFDPRARSRVGAVGYTQILPTTARLYDPGLSDLELFDRDTNLRLGFRYLRDQLERYAGDLRLALLSYNRGPSRVLADLRAGVDPGNGFASNVMGGYKRKG